MRKVFKILFFLLVMGCILLIIALDQVDYTPYFETPYYQSTLSRLNTQAKQIHFSEGQVNIGFSKVNITPVASIDHGLSPTSVPLAGYGNRKGQPAKGVHDSIYIKAMALQVTDALAVFVSADMLIMPPNIVDKAHERLSKTSKLTRAQVFYGATHTHSSIGGWSDNYVGKAFAGEPNPEIIHWLSEKLADVIGNALVNLKPGQIGHGNFEAPDLVKNRLIGARGQEHATFSFIQAQQHGGKKAIIGMFDAHATTLSGSNWEFSADYLAYWYQKLEQAGIDYPIFCAGSVGSHGPETRGKGFEKPQYLGALLADSVLKYSPLTIMKDTIGFSSLSLEIDLPYLQIRIADGWGLAPFLGKKLFPPIGEVFIQSARIGDFIWTTTPADFSGELALGHQNELFTKGFDSAITSFNGAYIGYVLPAKYFHFNEYESRVMSWFGPHMGPYLDEMIFRVTGELVAMNGER